MKAKTTPHTGSRTIFLDRTSEKWTHFIVSCRSGCCWITFAKASYSVKGKNIKTSGKHIGSNSSKRIQILWKLFKTTVFKLSIFLFWYAYSFVLAISPRTSDIWVFLSLLLNENSVLVEGNDQYRTQMYCLYYTYNPNILILENLQ